MSMQTTTFNADTLTYNPDEYVDSGSPLMPLPGTYRFRVTSLTRRKDRDSGQVILKDGKWPTLVLNRVEIVEPIDDAGIFGVFEEIYTKPYMRKGATGQPTPAAKHIDLLRAIDKSARPADFLEAVEEVEHLLASGQTFVAQLGYKAQDSDWARQQIAMNGGDSIEKELRNQIYNNSKLSTKDFKNPNGGYRVQAMGKSGKMLEAKLTLTKFIPSDQNVELGPFTR